MCQQLCKNKTKKNTERQRRHTKLNYTQLIWNPLEFNYLVTPRVQQHTGSSSLRRSVSRIMAVPSACWPHAVFPGLSGNKGRKTPFYSITLAALGHRANTKECGFIKTISARNEPNRLIHHQPWGARRGWLVFGGCGWVPRFSTWDRHLSHGFSF